MQERWIEVSLYMLAYDLYSSHNNNYCNNWPDAWYEIYAIALPIIPTQVGNAVVTAVAC
jgi:hypothetical protein